MKMVTFAFYGGIFLLEISNNAHLSLEKSSHGLIRIRNLIYWSKFALNYFLGKSIFAFHSIDIITPIKGSYIIINFLL